MRDRFYGIPTGMSGPATDAEAVTPNDNRNLNGGVCRSLYVGTAGDLSVMFSNGTVVTLKGAHAGYHPLRAMRVMASDTTAADILALY